MNVYCYVLFFVNNLLQGKKVNEFEYGTVNKGEWCS